MNKIPFALLLFSLLCFSAEAAPSENQPYIIGKDDILEISVWQSPDLTKTVPVEFDGAIEYSFLGRIDAAGLSVDDLQKKIAETLSKGYVKNPKVNITVKEYNSKKILVFGEVMKPGLYKLKGSIPLLELLFMVDGVKSEAKRLTIIRPHTISDTPVPQALRPQEASEAAGDQEEDGAAIEIDLISLLSKGDLTQNVMIMPGDTIYVSSGTGLRYYVLGQVKNPGPYEWVQDITVLDAIKLADGPTELAALNRIKVRKKKKSGREEEFRINVVDIMNGKKKDDVQVEADTIVIVPKSWI